MAFLPSPPPPFSSHPPPSSAPTTSLPYARRQRRPVAAVALPFRNPFTSPDRQHFLSRVEVLSRVMLPANVVDTAFATLVNNRVTRRDIDDALALCNAWFINNHYACSRLLVLRYPTFYDHTLVVMSVEPRITAMHLRPVNKEGKPIEGAPPPTTRKATVLRTLHLAEGDVFRWHPAHFGTLLALGLFDYADAEVRQTAPQGLELTLKIHERRSCRIEPGIGVNSDGRVYGDVSIMDSNFQGRAQRVQLEWQRRLDATRASGGLAFEDSRSGAKVPISFKARAYRDSNASRSLPSGRVSRAVQVLSGSAQSASVQGPGPGDSSLRYEKDRDGAMVEVGYRPGRGALQLTASPAVEKVLDGNDGVVQGVLQTSIMHITRLPIDLPKAGHLFRVEQSVGQMLGREGGKFLKSCVRLTQYQSVGKKASLALGLTAGFGSDNLPWHEQKSLGGYSNVRGYEYGELGRYRSYGTARMELRVPLTKVSEVPEYEEGVGINEKESKEALTMAPESGGSGRFGDMMSTKMFERLPALVGVMFGDLAFSDSLRGDPLGGSYGVGLRVGGVVSAEWTRTTDGKKAKLHFGLIDRNI